MAQAKISGQSWGPRPKRKKNKTGKRKYMELGDYKEKNSNGNDHQEKGSKRPSSSWAAHNLNTMYMWVEFQGHYGIK